MLALVLPAGLAMAQAPLPELRIEPSPGGSVLFVKNTSTQPLTGYLIELVDYPGSSYAQWQDEIGANPIAPGVEKRIPITNMTVGAVPEYVKIRAALFADGSTSGVPERIEQFINRRRAVLKAAIEIAGQLERTASKEAAVAYLKQRADSLQPQGKATRAMTQATIDQSAARSVALETLSGVEAQGVAAAASRLRSLQQSLQASKPAL